MHFHPHTPHLLLSASSDGLLCTTDAREHDEDEAGLHVGNWGCSIGATGWTDQSTDIRAGSSSASVMASSRVWAHSDMQTVALWSDEVRGAVGLHHFIRESWADV